MSSLDDADHQDESSLFFSYNSDVCIDANMYIYEPLRQRRASNETKGPFHLLSR